MKLSKRIFRFSGVVILSLFFILPVWLDSCKAVPVSSEEAVESEQPVPVPAPAAEERPDEERALDYAESRPRSPVRDELVAVFTKSELELDFRKSFYASEAQLFTAIYEGLFSYHPLTLEPVRAAAQKWEISDDKKQWTFTIREDAKYQNGDPLRAEDFRAAWISLLEPGKDSPYSSLFDIIEGARDFRLGNHESGDVGISAPDDKTLVVRLNSPAAFFPSMLCHHSFSPIHPSMLNEESWAEGRPVISNGPYYIDEVDDDHIALIKNPGYWDAGRVALNRITIKYAEDGDAASAMWNSGEAGWLAGEVNIDALTDRSGIEVNEMFATHYYYIRSGKHPWNDFRVRRALSLVLPWEKIREGHALPAKTLIFPFTDYPKIEGLDETNVEEAERLFAEAGFPKGVGLPELVIRITPSPDAERIAGLMAQSWFEILGVPVKIDIVPYREYFQALKQDDYDVGSTTWIGDFADPYTFLQMWRKDSNLNDARHNDDEYEALIEKSMTEEGAKRWETLADAEKLLLARGNVLPISYSPALNIVDLDEIDGWYHNVLDIHPFKYMQMRTRRPLPGVARADSPGAEAIAAVF